MTVHMTFTDIEEYNLRSIAILGCDVYSQITVAHVTLPKAVLSTVEIFAVYAGQLKNLSISYSLVTAPAVVSSFVSLNTFPQNLCTPVILSSVSSNVM